MAGKIGNLATQSDATVKEINAIISELMENSSKSLEIMNQINEISGRQLKAQNNTSQMFQNLQHPLNVCINSTDFITEHITMVNDQKDKVMGNVNTLGEFVADNAASTQEISSMAMELEDSVGGSKVIVENLTADVKMLMDTLGQFRF